MMLALSVFFIISDKKFRVFYKGVINSDNFIGEKKTLKKSKQWFFL
jgi:hypothetical protein